MKRTPEEMEAAMAVLTAQHNAALAGVPMVVLKALMGHSVITTTMRYSHSTEADARAAIALLEAGR